jgi:bacteriocin-like protein
VDKEKENNNMTFTGFELTDEELSTIVGGEFFGFPFFGFPFMDGFGFGGFGFGGLGFW